MTSEAPQPSQAGAVSAPSRPTARAVTRKQAYDHIVRLCRSLLWQMKRRGASVWFKPRSPQRDLMRRIFDLYGDDPEAVFLAYMEAGRDGKVAWPWGAEDMASRTHAEALWREGKLKGWFRR